MQQWGEYFTYVVAAAVVIRWAASEYKLRKKKPLSGEYKVIIHFETSKIKLTLNPEQFEHLNAVLNEKEGMFQIGDELDKITIYREAICWVKVKQK